MGAIIFVCSLPGLTRLLAVQAPGLWLIQCSLYAPLTLLTIPYKKTFCVEKPNLVSVFLTEL